MTGHAPWDELPDVRDGLTRKERIVLWVLSNLEAEWGARAIPTPVIYGHVVEHVDLGQAELVDILARLGARR